MVAYFPLVYLVACLVVRRLVVVGRLGAAVEGLLIALVAEPFVGLRWPDAHRGAAGRRRELWRATVAVPPEWADGHDHRANQQHGHQPRRCRLPPGRQAERLLTQIIGHFTSLADGRGGRERRRHA